MDYNRFQEKGIKELILVYCGRPFMKRLLYVLVAVSLFTGLMFGEMKADAEGEAPAANESDTGEVKETPPAEETASKPIVVDFPDVPAKHWAKSSIENAVKLGYVTGYPDGKFRPNDPVTYAEFMKMIVGALGLDVNTTDAKWYVPYLNAATDSGIYRTDFKDNVWNKPIPRIDMSRIAFRSTREDMKIVERGFDKNRFLYEATKAGLINGYGKGEIRPDGTTTRAESIAVIDRMLKVRGGEKLKFDKYAASTAEVLWHKTNVFTMLPRYFKPRSQEYSDTVFHSELMQFSADNGNFKCEVEKIIVVDIDDKKDPNHKFIPSDLMWWDGWDGSVQPVPKKGIYVALTFSHFKVTKKYKTSYQLCSAGFMNIQPKNYNPNKKHTVVDAQYAAESKSKGPKINIEFSGNFDKLKEQYYIEATVFPKGDLFAGDEDNDIITTIFVAPQQFGGKIVEIFRSIVDPNINQ